MRTDALQRLWWRAAVSAGFIMDRFDRPPKRFSRLCNLCGYEGFFAAAGKGTRIDAKCPRCNSAERHRHFSLWLENNKAAMAGADVLHFAPERSLSALIKPLAASYCSADIAPGRADRTLDLEEIDLPDGSFDCVVCVHVLEHVDDRKALKEIRRVLRPRGTLVVMVPVVEGWARTYEDDSIVGADLRTLHFGQADHLRIYGADIRDRIRAAGFALAEFTAEGPDVARYGLLRGEKVFVATRADAAA